MTSEGKELLVTAEQSQKLSLPARLPEKSHQLEEKKCLDTVTLKAFSSSGLEKVTSLSTVPFKTLLDIFVKDLEYNYPTVLLNCQTLCSTLICFVLFLRMFMDLVTVCAWEERGGEEQRDDDNNDRAREIR